MNPILIEITRGPLVESVHRGSIAIADAAGAIAFAVGDVASPVFPRSAVKPLQALPLIETGAADRFGYGDAELALACASHSGTAEHVGVASGMLRATGLATPALGCGSHIPLATQAAADLIRSGDRASALHNNCSGKHAGMLATAVHMGEPVDGYWRVDHAVQRRVKAAIEGLSGIALGDDVCGIDGCSVPNWAMPLSAMASAFACLVTGQGRGAIHRIPSARLMSACWSHPQMVAGPGRLDTEVMAAFSGEIFIKTGAEGVYCAGLPRQGLGIALKVDDGAKRAAEAAIIHVIGTLLPHAMRLVPPAVHRNWQGIATGSIRPSRALAIALEALARTTTHP